MASDLDRYHRQILFSPLGEAGQRKLMEGHALICGCGALGSVIANTLVRAGVGSLRIVDRDFLELNNLQRQVLYDEQDVADGLPKAIAAANKLNRINTQVRVEPVVADVTTGNLHSLAHDVDVIVDGTDNFETRFLLNDYAIQQNTPWIYGGCIGAEGQTMTVLPGKTACLSCLMSDVPPPGATPTCDTAGILGPIVNVIASLEAVEALKILSGNEAAVSRQLTVIDMWSNRIRQINLATLREQGDCVACGDGEFLWLAGKKGSSSAVLCGRNAVQLAPEGARPTSLESLEEKLAGAGRVTRNPFLLRLEVDNYLLTVFADGRTIVSGTDDITVARTLHAKYIGS